MSQEQPKNPLHGITLKVMLEDLVERRGWDDLASHIKIRCFMFEPTIGSSLKFLRRTPWARTAVEELYLKDLVKAERKRARKKPEHPDPED